MSEPISEPTGAAAAPAVAVLIVTYNSAPDLAGCLEVVAAQDHRPLELVVVDCASRDESVDIARRTTSGEAWQHISSRVEALSENRGFSGGMNEALRLSTAPFVLALNADARPATDFIHRLLSRMKYARAAAVTGRLVRPARNSSPEAGSRSSPGPQLLDACGMYLHPAWRHFDRGSGELDRGQLMTAELVFGATGAATLYRRAALRDVAFADEQIFDELFHSYREDAELCFRFQERGWQVIYEPLAVAEHRRRVVPGNRSSLPAAINRHSLKNRYLLRAYHQTAHNAVRTLLPALMRDLAALLFVLLVERSSFSAYLWLWRHRQIIKERRRYVQARRTESPASLERWFHLRELPLEET